MSGEPSHFNARAMARWLASRGRPHAKQPPGPRPTLAELIWKRGVREVICSINANESSDPEVVAATMSKPGVVLRRQVGSDAPFSEHPGLPTQLADDEPRHGPKKTAARPKQRVPPTDEVASKAIIAFENTADHALRYAQERGTVGYLMPRPPHPPSRFF
jgi:hypothetical protein